MATAQGCFVTFFFSLRLRTHANGRLRKDSGVLGKTWEAFAPLPLRQKIILEHCVSYATISSLFFLYVVFLQVSYPVGEPRTLTRARTKLSTRLREQLSVSGEPSGWNITTRRRIFAHWPALFTGLLEDHLQAVPYLASVLSALLYSTASGNINEVATRLYSYSFMG